MIKDQHLTEIMLLDMETYLSKYNYLSGNDLPNQKDSDMISILKVNQ